MELEKFTQNYINSLSTKNQEQIITIPVVVHVVYENIDEKIQAHQIQNQIDILNEDFRRLNSDTTNTPSEFSDEAVDTKIQFVLGCKESGITYTPTDHDYFYQANDSVKFDSLGGHDAWSADDYLNIWVCDLEENLLGYAQYPSGDEETDGVVIDYKAFGNDYPAEAPYHLGRTTTHEVGHWLNLYHIWGVGGCNSDDNVSDTPMQMDSYLGECPNHPQTSCNSHDMFMNYMDYTNDACMNLFTEGQKNRIRALFASGGPRESFAEKCIQELSSLNLYIDGHDLVCSTNKTFELKNIPPNTCADIVWTKSTNLELVSGQGSDSYTIRAKTTANGPGWVKATITDDCDSIPIRYDIDWVGVPYVNPSSIHFECVDGSGYFCTNAFGNEFSFTFDHQFNYFDTKLTNLSETQTFTQFRIYDTWGTMDCSPPDGTYLFQVRGNNECATATNWTKKAVDFVDCGMGGLFSLDIYPNPATEQTTITIVSNEDMNAVTKTVDEEWQLEVYSQGQLLKHSVPAIIDNKYVLNTSGWKPGMYFIRAYYKDEVVFGTLVVNK